MATLQSLSGKTQAELIEMLMAQQKAAERKITAKPSEKGALSVYGLGRFPVTLYRSQWERLGEWIKEGHLDAALAMHSERLTSKD
jgi:hypothetical protein